MHWLPALRAGIQHANNATPPTRIDIATYDETSTEDASLLQPVPGIPDYPHGKAASERRLVETFPGNLTIVRPGSISGYRDAGMGLQTWLLRARNGGEQIAPGDGNDHIQMVDVRDVARFLAICIDRSISGTFNLTGDSRTFRSFIDSCNVVTRRDARFIWIGTDFLRNHDPEWPAHFPYYRPNPMLKGFYQVSSEKARNAGWMRRGFDETASDTLLWYGEEDARVPAANGPDGHWQDSLTPARSAALIKEWRDATRARAE